MLSNPTRTRLEYFFERNGYLRSPDPARREEEGYAKYKKGYEVRLVARDEVELQEIRRLLQLENFQLARSHSKANRFIQPIYGKQAVERFCEVVGQPLEVELTEK